MGVFVVLANEAGTPVEVKDPPTAFRLSMINPVTGLPYCQSRWRDLPDYAAEIIESHSNLCGGEWDVLVEDGEVAEFLDIDQVHIVCAARKQPQRRPACDDYWRMTDINPNTGKSFMDSPWRTLPGYVCDTLCDVWGYTPGSWNGGVAARAGGAR
jgi:hypothetical protein